MMCMAYFKKYREKRKIRALKEMPVSSPTETYFSMAYTKQRSLEEKKKTTGCWLEKTCCVCLHFLISTNRNTWQRICFNRPIEIFHCIYPGRFVIIFNEMMSHLSTSTSSTCLSIKMNDSFWSDCIVEFDLNLERWSLRVRLIIVDQMEKLNKERLHVHFFVFLRSSSSILN